MISRRTIVLAPFVALIAMQVVPIHHDNPPATGPLSAPPAPVMATVRRACYDCHSHETIWPWYSYIAPMSWLVARDVHEGRRHLNFSSWTEYPPAVKAKKLAGISALVQEREMPPWFYLPLHDGARLSEDDISVLATWADSGTDQ
jgi:Haem-binding domain